MNVRRTRKHDETGNHVSSWLVPLPLGLEDPLAQLESIRKTTAELKAADEAGAVTLAMTALDLLGVSVQNLSVGTLSAIVTNVPGPPFPLYLLGARAQQMIPMAPLLENLGLSIGVLSYDGQMFWGFDADADRVPDLADFHSDIERAFERLAAATGVVPGAEPTLAEPPLPESAEPAAACARGGRSARSEPRQAADVPAVREPAVGASGTPTAH